MCSRGDDEARKTIDEWHWVVPSNGSPRLKQQGSAVDNTNFTGDRMKFLMLFLLFMVQDLYN